MVQNPKEKGTRTIEIFFSRIATRYDLMNRLMTGGQDQRWRKKVIQKGQITPRSEILDLGTGTGDLTRTALQQHPEARVTAADLTLEMLLARKDWHSARRCCANAEDLPFPADRFDVVLSGFLARNVCNLEKALQEQHRVLRSGGRIVILDTTRPRKNPFSPLIQFYMTRIIPSLGALVTGQKDAYSYLIDSTQNFLCAEDLAVKMKGVGFQNVSFETLMFGTIAIHVGNKS
ncbi:MAG: ubiquinone/menaquinone biosynthesis methyltransferase [Chloroflexi bacterium]|nr:ubiquinone/menaquinone biosynthesis methyltransferase [Chloroflexota bacterium]